MRLVRSRLKLISILVITAILSAGCAVPDISEFAKQSAEMTRGIRTGVKDTESVIKSASERSDLFSDKVRGQLRQNLKDYRTGMKPTLESLDALDAYLEALNALAQANKKSAENSKAVVDSVGNLVTAVSGLTFASTAVNVATGILTVAEQFRTAKSFKKRVNLAAEIVEGGLKEKLDAEGRPILDEKGKPILVKACVGKAEDSITKSSHEIKELVANALAGLTADQLKGLEPLSPAERRAQLVALGKIDGPKLVKLESDIGSFKCGAIDLIKFNVRDLKEINLSVSGTMLSNAREKNRTILGFYESIEATDRRIQHELETILNYKTLVALIRELEATGGSPQNIQDAKISLKHHADDLFVSDGQLKNDIFKMLGGCGADCGQLQRFLEFELCETCEQNFISIIKSITKAQFDHGNGNIEEILEQRAAVLHDQNTKYLEELKRITPAHSVAIAELKSIGDKQDQLDKLLDTSVSALDAWAKSHANLRVAVNTRKPLTVGQLASKVREIWSIINPAATD